MLSGFHIQGLHTPTRVFLLRLLLLVLAYVAAGRLSLLLAIPPGFVSGLFLPMGIALAAVLIWGLPMAMGVFVGSTLLNISISPTSSISLPVVLIAAEIACGSTLAVVAGATLIRRYVGFPNTLTDERQIFAFFALGGPVATSLSASVGVFVLYVNGFIPLENTFYSWWTWWIGDAIGVLIATPLVCVLFAEPRHFWRGRRNIVGIPMVISSLIVVAVFVMSSTNEQKKLNDQFIQQARLVSGAVDGRLSSVVHTLASLQGLYAASEEVTRAEFSRYIDQVIVRDNGVSGFTWNQRVLHKDRAAYEDAYSYIKEQDSVGAFYIAPERSEYIAITYVEPWQKNALMLGFNDASESVRQEVLIHARDTGHFAMTPPLHILLDDTFASGVVMYYPVYERTSINNTFERREALIGYVTAIVRTNDLIASVLAPFSADDYQLNIVDVTDPGKEQIFYGKKLFEIPDYARDLVLQQEMTVGGRKLLISVGPTEKFLSEHVSLQSWFVLAGGLLFCSLLGGFLLLISGRTQHISNLVDQRTKELAAILENAVESILVVDEQGFIEKANPAAANLFKYPLPQFSTLNITDLVPALRVDFKVQSDKATTSYLREMVGRCSDGSDRDIELSVSPVAIHERKFFTFIIHDATAKRKVERLKSEFISTVSHELRTPLTSIKGALSIVLNGGLGDLADKIRDLLVIANNNAERLARLVNDILDIDKLAFGDAVLNLKLSPIYPLLQQSVEQNQGYSARYGVHVALETPDSAALSCTANVDIDRFIQVMANLLSNAIKFSYLEGVVRVKLTCDERELTISVIDEGQGIAEDFRARMFQRFAQVDSSDTRRRDGTGLGLSITKAIIERMGGKIDYLSQPGKGSTFYFTLPLAR